MRENLAPVRCVIQEKNANLDVEIIRRDRAILYRVRPRKVLTVREEASKWKRPAPVTQVEELINIALEKNARQSSTKVVCLCFSFVVCVVVIETPDFVNSFSLHRVYKAIPRAKINNSLTNGVSVFPKFSEALIMILVLDFDSCLPLRGYKIILIVAVDAFCELLL